MVYVNITIIADEHFQSEGAIFNFYQDHEITVDMKNTFKLSENKEDDENGILVHYSSGSDVHSIASSEDDFNDNDFFYSWKDLWEEYDNYIGENSVS